MTRFHVIAVFAVGLTGASCGTAKPGGMSEPTIGRMTDTKAAPLESADILRRTRTAEPTWVKHVLIGWDDLEDNYDGKMDAKAKARTRFDAERLVRDLSKRLDAGEPIEVLMMEYSSDLGTKDGRAIRVASDSAYLARFIALSIRLNVGEVGVVKTGYGYHLIKRVR